MKSPMIPRHPTNPIGQVRRIEAARRAVFRDINRATEVALETVASWRTVKTNRTIGNRAYYEYQVDEYTISALTRAIETVLSGGGGPEAVRKAVEAAYREGVGKAAENLFGLLDGSPGDVASRLRDAKTLRNAVIAGSRAFEEMQGFSGQTAKDLGQVLFRAIQDGENPKQTAKTIRERFGVSKSRAERIARTEITGALRRGRWDEVRETQKKVGDTIRLIHYSALIFGRTRTTHAERHGKIVTVGEQAAWYASNGNAINCLCSQSEVVVDENGEPIFGKALLDRMAKQKAAFLGRPVEKTTKTPPRPKAPPPPPPPPSTKDYLAAIGSMPNFRASGTDIAFSDAPLPALRALNVGGDLPEFSRSSKDQAYLSGGRRIEMGTELGDVNNPGYRRILRHETGHLVDWRIGNRKGRNDFGSWDAVDALVEDGREIEANRLGAFGHDLHTPPKGRSAGKRERDSITRLLALSRKRTEKERETAEVIEQAVGFDVKKNPKALNDWIVKETGFTTDQVRNALPNIDRNGSEGWAEFATAWRNRDGYTLSTGLAKEYGSITHADPWPGVQDAIEAATGANLKSAFGHGKSYYTKRKKYEQFHKRFKNVTIGGKATYVHGFSTGQAFANWFEAYGSGDALQYGIFKRLFPRTSAAFEALLEEYLNG